MGLMLVGAPNRASAQTAPTGFTASSSADIIRVTTDFPGLPLSSSPVDSGGPTAQAYLDSLGNSQAYAAAPDPGTLVGGLPALGAGVLSGDGINLPFPIPAYPLSVTTDSATQPQASEGQGPYKLRARSGNSSSDAQTTVGGSTSAGDFGYMSAAASVVNGQDGPVSQATSDLESITVGPLYIGHIQSTASMSVGYGGQPTAKASTIVEGAAVDGIGVNLSDAGIGITSAAVPVTIPPAVETVLRSAGITVKTFSGAKSSTGIVAPVVQITQSVTLPQIGAGTVTYTVGGTSAQLQLAAPDGIEPADMSVPSTGPANGPGSGSAGTGPAGGSLLPSSSVASTASPSRLGVAAPVALAPVAIGGSQPNSAAGTSSSGQPSVGSPAASPTRADQGRVLAAGVIPLRSTSGLYLVLVLAALAGIVAVSLVRYLGVRLRWKF